MVAHATLAEVVLIHINLLWLAGAKLPLSNFTKRGLKKLKANIKGTEKFFLDTLLLTEVSNKVICSLD